MSSRTEGDDLATLLDDGIRYDRSGVSARARACFVEITERAARASRHRRRGVVAAGERAAAAVAVGRRDRERARRRRARAQRMGCATRRRTRSTSKRRCGRRAATRGAPGSIFERMLELATRPITRAKALQNLGGLAAEERRFDEAERLFGASRDAYREADDLRGEACSLLNIGRLQAERGDPALAKETLQAAVHQSRTAGDMEMHAAALLNLGIALGALGEHARSGGAHHDGVRSVHDRRQPACSACAACCSSPTLATGRGEPDAARVCLVHAREIATRSELPRELRLIDEQPRPPRRRADDLGRTADECRSESGTRLALVTAHAESHGNERRGCATSAFTEGAPCALACCSPPPPPLHCCPSPRAATPPPRRAASSPARLRKDMSPGPDGTCRSGYHVATRSDGMRCVRRTECGVR